MHCAVHPRYFIIGLFPADRQ
uniref:Uncharacterized protein n=1 Tax=Anguilla anguilla TaxID=7936 RepID=A0A0E9U7Q3_ANGAN